MQEWRDGKSYDNIARHLIAGEGYRDTTGEWPGEPPYADPARPTTRWLPGYPLFVAGVYAVTAPSYRMVHIAQALLSLPVALLLYALGKRAVGPSAATVTVFLYAIDPFSIHMINWFQTETVFTLLLLGMIYCFSRTGEAGIGYVILFGITAAIATLTRAVGVFILGGLLAVGLAGFGTGFGELRLSRRLLRGVLAVGVFALVLTPWMVRSQALNGKPVLTTESWQSLAVGNNDAKRVDFEGFPNEMLPKTDIHQSEIVRDDIYRQFVKTWVLRHPAEFAALYLKRAVLFWRPTTKVATGAQALVAIIFNLSLWFLAAYGAICFRNRWPDLLPIYVAIAICTALYALSIVATRYRIPLYPLIEILAGAGLIEAGRRRLGRRSESDDLSATSEMDIHHP